MFIAYFRVKSTFCSITFLFNFDIPNLQIVAIFQIIAFLVIMSCYCEVMVVDTAGRRQPDCLPQTSSARGSVDGHLYRLRLFIMN